MVLLTFISLTLYMVATLLCVPTVVMKTFISTSVISPRTYKYFRDLSTNLQVPSRSHHKPNSILTS